MKKHQVIMNITVGGIVSVYAKDKKAAENRAREKLQEIGEAAFCDVGHRDIMFCGFLENKKK